MARETERERIRELEKEEWIDALRPKNNSVVLEWSNRVVKSSGQIEWSNRVVKSSGQIKWSNRVVNSSERARTGN